MAFKDESGFTWKNYIVQYKTLEGTFQCEISATSFEHAELILYELKETAFMVSVETELNKE